jgi:hypothetical protein
METLQIAQAPVPLKNSSHSWSIAMFEMYRPRLTDFIKARILPLIDSEECCRILIRAPVKSGKREMVEYIAKRDEAHHPARVHAFVSAFHRVSDETQRMELKNHNIYVFSLTTQAKANQCIMWIEAQLAEDKQIVIHLDECDFASGERQILSILYSAIRINPNITTILYSATPQEVLFSGEIEDEEYQEMVDNMIHTGERIEYIPPESFCGPARFLDAGLVTEAKPFFRKYGNELELTIQGREIITDLRAHLSAGKTARNMIILRLSYVDLGGSRVERKENKAIYQFLKKWQTIPELSGCLVYADKGEKEIPDSSNILKEKIQWSNRLYWEAKRSDIPIIIVIDQTSSRSTEWACHDRVFATHDYRNSVIFSVLSQAQERVNHYETQNRYDGFQPIKIYGHLKTFQLSAGRITYGAYMNHEWTAVKLDIKAKKQLGLPTTKGTKFYRICRTTNEDEIHPVYSDPVDEEECMAILQEIGCHVEVKVSARVKGGVKQIPVYECEFFECTKDSFLQLKSVLEERLPQHKFKNPFITSTAKGLVGNRYMGYLRGWQVLDYETQVKTQAGWGVVDGPRLTICYHDGVLGIALRYDTGHMEEQNTLDAYRSMYGL